MTEALCVEAVISDVLYTETLRLNGSSASMGGRGDTNVPTGVSFRSSARIVGKGVADTVATSSTGADAAGGEVWALLLATGVWTLTSPPSKVGDATLVPDEAGLAADIA